jgi:hypothetical protein
MNGTVVAQYRPPVTSDKREGESWRVYWDRKRLALHNSPERRAARGGRVCVCTECMLHALGIGDQEPWEDQQQTR